jgi:hypothetical protein
MTFGEQTDEREAHAQLDCALAHGVNFIDTAEMYPIPPGPKTYLRTESIVARLARRASRAQGWSHWSPVLGRQARWRDHYEEEHPLKWSTTRSSVRTDYVDLPDPLAKRRGRCATTPRRKSRPPRSSADRGDDEPSAPARSATTACRTKRPGESASSRGWKIHGPPPPVPSRTPTAS